ncbi:MAG: cation:proton antiporter [Lactobacillaceae bacterium]|jgi:CPA1 family monovalent cation:H+ antiporter|nr:cation:proton antiporter [Lactobacillaceae bacterium]
MTIIFTLATLLAAIIVANFLSQALPAYPKAFWQILAGIILAVVPALSHFAITLEPEWFMMLIIAPLLFYEGQKTNVRLVSKNLRAVVRLAGFLAVETVVVVGFIAFGILGWPLAIAVALAAIVTPTDATALESVTDGREVPKGIKQALSLESLFNDATGLVALELALLWANTGHFSFLDGIKEFMIVALGGALIGLLFGGALVYVRQHLLKHQFDDRTAQVMIQIMTPIVVFAVAEHFGLSGIIAVVVTGIIHNEEHRKTMFLSVELNDFGSKLWDTVAQILNGIVFVLLGMSLVRVFKGSGAFTLRQFGLSIGVAIVIYLAMGVLRYISVRDAENDQLRNFFEKENHGRDAWVFAFGGVHGTMTMAMAFSLPLTLVNGATFPFRDEITFIATMVILLSLLVPRFVLPRILPAIKPEYDVDEMQTAHVAMVDAAMGSLQELNLSQADKQAVTTQLKDQLGYGNDLQNTEMWQQAVNQIDTIREQTMDDAMSTGAISDDAVMLWKNFANGWISRSGKRKNYVWKWWIRQIERKLRKIMQTPITKKQRQTRSDKEVELIQRRFDRHKAKMPAARQAQMQARIDQMRLRNSHDDKQARVQREDIQKRWLVAFQEIDDIVRPAIDAYIQSLEDDHADKRLIVALRDNEASAQLAARDQVETATSDRQDALLYAMQAELGFIQRGIAQDELSHALGKQLYNEVTAAQSLVLALGKDDE